jgi:hypothetical protein
MAKKLSEHFNLLARSVDAAEVNLEELLQSETDRQISIWVHLARAAALSTFGTEKEVQAAMEQTFLLFKSNFGEAKAEVPASNLSQGTEKEVPCRSPPRELPLRPQ